MTIILEGISVFQIKSFLTADTRLFYEFFFYEACDIHRFCRSSLSVDRVLKESKIRTFFYSFHSTILNFERSRVETQLFFFTGTHSGFWTQKTGSGVDIPTTISIYSGVGKFRRFILGFDSENSVVSVDQLLTSDDPRLVRLFFSRKQKFDGSKASKRPQLVPYSQMAQCCTYT